MADPVIVQQLAKRRAGPGDGVPRRPGELAKVNLDDTVLDRTLAALGQEQHLAIVGVATVAPVQHFEDDVVAVELAKRGGHVALVHQQRAVRLRQRGAVDRLDARQRALGQAVKLIEWMGQHGAGPGLGDAGFSVAQGVMRSGRFGVRPKKNSCNRRSICSKPSRFSSHSSPSRVAKPQS